MNMLITRKRLHLTTCVLHMGNMWFLNALQWRHNAEDFPFDDIITNFGLIYNRNSTVRKSRLVV